MAAVRVTSMAPLFELEDHHGKPVRLAEFRGKNVVLCFFPMAWSPACTEEQAQISRRLDEIQRLNAVVFGISTASVESHRTWALQEKIAHPLLSDPNGSVCDQYGLFDDFLHVAKRATVIVDPIGVIRLYHIDDFAKPRDLDHLIDCLRSL